MTPRFLVGYCAGCYRTLSSTAADRASDVVEMSRFDPSSFWTLRIRVPTATSAWLRNVTRATASKACLRL